ncbi:helix-turn-helix domain-containing protein [Aminobacter sp. AP02]|uniref:helix-turn-helix domain-containing protein n=1 Tax=Aminobacter sp. AP02 TaxID=2135737 RepID=UPI000D6AB512
MAQSQVKGRAVLRQISEFPAGQSLLRTALRLHCRATHGGPTTDPSKQEPTKLDLVWGIQAIADLIGRTLRQTYHMLRSGHLRAKQLGNRWVVDRNELERFFREWR